MKLRNILLFTAIGSSLLLGQIPDPVIRKHLPGQWSVNHQFDAISVSGTSFFGTDGIAYYDGTIRGADGVIKFQVSARWSVAGGKVITQVIESSNPDIFSVGSTEIDSVVVLNDSLYSYIDKDGGSLTEKRIPYN